MSYDCPFCEMLDAHTSAWHRSWAAAVAFTPLSPVAPGHLLVIPRVHVADATTDPTVTGDVFAAAAELARDFPACNLITSCGAAATQSVLHLHVHVVPRVGGDGLSLPWTGRST